VVYWQAATLPPTPPTGWLGLGSKLAELAAVQALAEAMHYRHGTTPDTSEEFRSFLG
jgi:hypothetical protein